MTGDPVAALGSVPAMMDIMKYRNSLTVSFAQTLRDQPPAGPATAAETEYETLRLKRNTEAKVQANLFNKMGIRYVAGSPFAADFGKYA